MILSFTQAIKEATGRALETDPRVHVLGLGATYPNGLDGTMGDLALRFLGRVHDSPVSENCLSGMAVGMAACGLRPIVHHGRIEFSLYAADPIISQAANWNYQFGGYPCPVVFRICVGRQWGNGPQHTRAARGTFAVPGLHVVMPSSPQMAYNLLREAHSSYGPTVFLEPRWLYKLKQTVDLEAPWDSRARCVWASPMSPDVTFIGIGDSVLECIMAARVLAGMGIGSRVIDAVALHPLDEDTLVSEANVTGHVIVVDSAPPAFGFAREAIGVIAQWNYAEVEQLILDSVTCPDVPCPTATSLTANYYPTAESILKAFFKARPDLDEIQLQPRSFEELNLPPAMNIDELLAPMAVTEPCEQS